MSNMELIENEGCGTVAVLERKKSGFFLAALMERNEYVIGCNLHADGSWAGGTYYSSPYEALADFKRCR